MALSDLFATVSWCIFL